jgi:acyl transferase domain-containing protein
MHEAAADLNSSQRVLLALKKARARLEAAERAATEPIAVVGIGCRFPGGAHGPEDYWRLLLEGFDAVGEIPRDRYDVDAYYDSTPGSPGKMYMREGAFLQGIDQFDASFFGISPREAFSLDPQQRLLLEVTWEALEQAGQAPDKLRGSRCGVFIGIGRNDYAHKLLRGALESITAWDATGNGLCYGPGRLAHALDLKGPNLAIDTACSSSLMAVHLACQSLRLRECDLAIAGGCHVHLSPQVAIMLSMSRALAADGRCKTFDAAADGFGQGEGCGIVVLRRLSDALECRGNILALIRGSAINHDGHSSGLTVPNQAAQEQVIRDALANARIEPREIGYVEAHGTGTLLGDPIEVEALAAVLCRERPRDGALLVGSVKTNLGHLEAAAGIAGLIKVVLALRHGTIPPHLHFRHPNPRIPWDQLAIRIPTRPTPWERGASPRLAGVSSFGMSGANAHVVLQEPPPPPEPEPAECERPLHVVALSARSASALREQARRMEAHLAAHLELPLPDVAFTTNAGRTHFPVRVGLVAASRAELSRDLCAVASGHTDAAVLAEDEAERPGVVFLFSGQGSQYRGMARQLYATQPLVRRVLDCCDEILRPLLDVSLCELLFAGAHDRRLDQTLYTQPALFSVEFALAELWRSWGVVPRAVLGHGVGEYVGACVAGVFGLEDGLRLIAERSRLMQALPGGKMVAVFAAESRVRDAISACGNDVPIAAVNGAANVVIAGPHEPLRTVVARLEAEGVGTRELNVSHAFHSPMMEPMLSPFTDAARRLSYVAPRIDFVSNVTGRLHAQPPAAEYWVKHVREPVRFADGIDTLARRGDRIFVEIGPGSTLLGMAGRHLADLSPVLLPSLLPEQEEWRALLRAVARLYECGVAIDWAGFDRDYKRRRVALPTYPFERQRFWCEDVGDSARVSHSQRKIPACCLSWQEQAASPARLAEHSENPGRWLVFADRDGIGDRLGRMLEERHDECVFVDAGDRFVRTSAVRWTIDPGCGADFIRLFENIPDPASWKGIVFTWGREGKDAAEPTADEILAAQMRSCGGVLHLVQALAVRAASGTRLWFVTRNAVAAKSVEPEPPDLSQASIWGMGKAIALEHPELWGGMIDLPSRADDEALAQLVRELEAESAEDHILLRDGRRFVARLEPLTGARAEPAALHGDGTYLITGGLGDLGLHVASWMVGRGARNIVLIGRREPSSAAHARIAELQERGATVVAARADVAEAAELERVLAQLAASLPRLRGVVHAAGVYGHDALTELDADTLQCVLRPKVKGAWLLHQLTLRLDLDFFVCFSSAAALWGSKGQAHYAAANAFLDALAHYRRWRGLPAASIDWGPWEGDGMANAEARTWLARVGIRSLRPEDALAAMEQNLSAEHPHFAIADVDWARFSELYGTGRKRLLLANLAPAERRERAEPAPRSASLEAEFAHLTVGERRDWLVTHLQREVCAVLSFSAAEPPDPRAGFFRLGMDSLMAVELKNRLARDFRVALSATVIFDYPNIIALAAYLATHVLEWDLPAQEGEDKDIPAPALEEPALANEPAPLPEPIAAKLARLETLMRQT